MRRATVAALLLAAALAAPARAQPRDPLNGAFSLPPSSLRSSLDVAPPSQAREPGITRQRLAAAVRVSSTEASGVSLHASADALELDRSLPIPGTAVDVPRQLWDLEAGAAYRRRLGERRDWGVSGSVGSASDEPFHSARETTLLLTGTYRIPSGARNAWLFLLSYSNNRHFANNVPFPGVAYIVHDPDHGLDAIVGIPFLALSWRPNEAWSARLSVFGPRNLALEEARRVGRRAWAYAGYDWGQRSWLRAGRTDRGERLFFDRKAWSLGLRGPLGGGLSGDVSAGYEFSRRFYENARAVGSGVPAADLAPAWTLRVGLDWRWR